MRKGTWGYMLAAIFFTLLVLDGCAKKEEAPPRPPSESRREITAASMPQEASVPATRERKFVIAHNIRLEVKDFSGSFEAISRMAEHAGGYNTEVTQNRNYDGRKFGKVAMRVPPKGVNGLLESVRKLGEVTSEEKKSEDITEQYYDLDARLRNAKASEVRLRELLGKRTGKISDVLEVEKELTRVRGEIESMEARKRNMEIETSLTTIVIELSEPLRAMPVAKKIWDPIRTVFGPALEVFAHSIRYLIFAIIGLTPWAAIVIMALYFRKRYFIKKQKHEVPDQTMAGEK